MGYEVLGRAIDLGGPESTYTRPVNKVATDIGICWRREIRVYPVQEVTSEGTRNAADWIYAVASGLEKLKASGIRDRKLVVRVAAV